MIVSVSFSSKLKLKDWNYKTHNADLLREKRTLTTPSPGHIKDHELKAIRLSAHENKKKEDVLRASQVKSLHHGSLTAGASRTRYLPADHVASGEVGPRGRACSAGWERTFQTGADESHESDVPA